MESAERKEGLFRRCEHFFTGHGSISQRRGPGIKGLGTLKALAHWAANLRFLVLLLSLFYAQSGFAEETLCAVVKMEIQQELTLEHQAFDAHMRINNGLDTLSLENVQVNVIFTDENGAAVVASSDPDDTNPEVKFFITQDSLEGITAVDGSGFILPSSSADIHWLIIPRENAAEDLPQGKLYFVGASLSYTVGGEPESVEVAPDAINVKPLPQLALDYFLTDQVYANEPFTLGVRVKNNSASATAKSVTIDSAQPTITENDQGLLIDFRIVGASVNEQALANSLAVNMGDIAPQAASMGRWSLLTTLSGQFTTFDASVSHSDELGGELTSLFGDPVPHTLVRDVRVDLPGRDAVRDYLALDADALRVYESSGVDTVVTDQSVTEFPLNSQSGTEVFHALNMDVVAEFIYAQVTDPYDGTKEIKAVTRSDGKVIPAENVWLSRTPKIDAPAEWDYHLNLFDAKSTGVYVVVLDDPVAGPSAPVFNPIAPAVTYEGNPVSFVVSATDADGTIPALTSAPLPVGATFVDYGDGTGTFSWAPVEGQAGGYRVVLTASDGELTDEVVAAVKVNPVWDKDGDGMDDAWELQHFGTLDRDGTGDFDGDGILDLLEYENGYDPALGPPAPPANLSAIAGNTEITLSWDPSEGATGYNLYWAQATGVTPETGSVLAGAVSPQLHDELTNDTVYYYVVTAIGPGGESSASVEVSAVPEAGDWGAPVRIEQDDSGSAQAADVANAPSGDGMAVWSHSDGTRTNIQANRYVAGIGWETPVLIETENLGDAGTPRVALDTQGNAVAVWQQSDGTVTNIWANRYVAGTGWGSAVLIESNGADAISPRVAVDPAGNAAVIWRQDDGLWFNRYDAQTDTWGTAEPVTSGAGLSYPAAELGVDDNGNVIAVWSETSDGQSFTVSTRRYVPGTGWESTFVLDDAVTTEAISPQVIPALAVAGGGDALALWERSDGTQNDIWAARYTGGAWSAPFSVESHVGDGFAPVVAYSGDGSAVAAWLRNDGTRTSVWANRMDVNGAWATAVAIETDDTADTAAVRVAADGFGNAFAIWHQGDSVLDNIWVARYATGSGWEPPVIIDTENEGDARFAAIDVDPDGGALAVWEQSDGTLTHITANAYATGNTGVPNIPPVVWAGPDQAVAIGAEVTLGGNIIFDQDGAVVTHAWTQTSGPVITLTGADTIAPTFTAPSVTQATALNFDLAVTDDGAAVSHASMQVIVLAADPDADADGMQDLWELQTFGTLDRDGSLDFDGDGFSDLQEYQQGTNATLSTPVAPTGLQAMPAVGEVTLSWQPVTGASSYNIYWGSEPGVTPSSGTLIANADSPYLHSGLTPETAYYYVVTAVTEDESLASAEVNAIPGRRAWEISKALPSADNEVSSTQLSGDRIMAVWSASGDIVYSLHTDAGGWAPAQPLESNVETATLPNVASDGLGNATTVWVQSNGTVNNLWANRYSTGTGWNAPEMIAADIGDGQALQVATDDSGAAVVVWRKSDSYWANTYASGTGWGAAALVAATPGDRYDYSDPTLAMGGGVATVAWERNASPEILLEVLRYTDGSGWGSIEQVANVSEDVYGFVLAPAVSMDAGGDIVVLWHREWAEILASRYTSAQGWETATVAVPEINVNGKDVVMIGDHVVAVWSCSYGVYVTEYSPDSGWSQVNQLSDQYAFGASVGIDHDGRVVVTYTASGGSGEYEMLALARAPGSQWGVPQLLSGGELAKPTSAAIHVGDIGPTVIWKANSGETFSSRYRLFDAPPISEGGEPQSIYGGQTVVLDGSGSTDLDGAIVTYRWVGAHPFNAITQALAPEGLLTGPVWSVSTLERPVTLQHRYALVVTDDSGAMVTDTLLVTVLQWDTDFDGLRDLWELDYFGNLDHDGTQDFDGDGLTNSVEYQNGTDPTVTTPIAPTGVDAVSVLDGTKVSWQPVADAVSYNLYWSTESGVTRETGNKISGVSSPYPHSGLALGTEYYYIVTAVGAADESAASLEVSARAGWGSPVTLETNTGDAGLPSVSANAVGDAMAVWSQSDGTRTNIWANRYSSANGSWGAAELIESDDAGAAENPRVQIDGSGSAVAVWQQSDGARTNIWANRYTAGTGWGTAELIESEDLGSATNPRLALDADGNATVVWEQSDGTRTNIWANHYSVVSGWGVPALIETDDNGAAMGVSIATNGNGDSAVVWEQSDGTRTNIWANTYLTSSGWGTAELIESDDVGDAGSASVAVDADGNAMAVWQQSDGTRTNIWANRYTPSLGWAAPELLETDDSGPASDTQLAVDGSGTVTAVWQQSDGVRSNIWANRYVAGVGWGTATLIETDDTVGAFHPAVAANSSGDVVVLWEHETSSYRIKANRYLPGLGWATATLIGYSDSGTALAPAVSVDGQGNAFAVWRQWDYTTWNIDSAREALQ